MMMNKGFIFKITYITLLAAILYAIVLTMSRGAMASLFVVLFLIFLRSTNKFTYVLFLGIALIFAWGKMSDLQRDRYLSMFGQENEFSATATGRYEGMLSELRLGLSKPIVGHGLGTTAEAKANIYGRTQASHNMYAELLIEVGILGFCIFVFYMINIKKNINSLIRRFVRPVKGNHKIDFIESLTLSVNLCFWMYLVYSVNYWGLSVYHWYLLGALSVCLASLKDRGKPADGAVI